VAHGAVEALDRDRQVSGEDAGEQERGEQRRDPGGEQELGQT
jgi:hypothetical protein